MLNKLLCIILFVLGMCAAVAQEPAVLQGRVTAGAGGVKYAYVINTTSGVETRTEPGGNFTISAKPGDVLVVYNTNITVREFMLTAESFKEKPYVISVNYTAAELDEVVITKYGNITTESLGLAPPGQVRYTPAERRLFEAGYGTISIGALINTITGRIAKLKRAAATEKQVFILEGLRDIYTVEDITAQFNIPEDHVEGFMFYLAEKKDFGQTVKQGNTQYIKFLMIEHAKDYLKLQDNAE